MSNYKYDIGERPMCPTCNIRTCNFNGFSKKDGRPLFRKLCKKCNGDWERFEKPRREVRPTKPEYGDIGHRRMKELTCDKCGFKAEHHCQLDIDHIDGNHANNEQSNLQVLCANCHRLKTWKNKDTAKKPTQ